VDSSSGNLNLPPGTGRAGEAAARSFVARKLDYEIVETNFRTREGEIDIVARSDHELVFIEVKTRTSKKFGHGVEQISRTKAQRLQTTARRYLEQNGLDDVDWRLDLLVVEMTRSGRVLGIQHVENAIEEQG
jgi:putative endonuclease